MTATTEIRIRGLVQGVGFRPTIFRVATRLGLSGDVRNDSDGCLIRVVASLALAERLVLDLKAECPPLARIDSVEYTDALPLVKPDRFRIASSGADSAMCTEVAPDAATCLACLAEIRDPSARRFRYPFTNCTHCGPRLSIIREVPYDRARTSMASFSLCDACRAEYEDPADRRFHAQPIACPVCGPRVTLEQCDGAVIGSIASDTLDDVDAAAGLLLAGHIVAIKGIGGYQLACDATNRDAVARLRQRKHRYGKAFALMARDLDVIRRFVGINSEEAAALTSTAAPIVLLDANGPLRLPEEVAPGLTALGFMLPSTPLHHLMFQKLDRPIVMTSGNRSGDAQIIDDAAARRELAGIADYILLHDRDIAVRLDDSILRFVAGAPRLTRRARGFAPASIAMPDGLRDAPPLLAMGGELKSTFCVVKDGNALVSQHIGDLEDAEQLDEFENNLAFVQRLHASTPDAIVVDLHPEYLSTKLGLRMAQDKHLPVMRVQHHHAHIASAMAENGLARDGDIVLGIALDGIGLGDDGTLWGGEFLLCNYHCYRRVGTFKPVALPGGAAVMRQPWRSAVAHILAAMEWSRFVSNFAGTSFHDYLMGKPVDLLASIIRQGINSPPASSSGRLFDAVAAAIGICRDEVLYEGEAAMRLEALVDREALAAVEESAAYPFSLSRVNEADLLSIDPSVMWRALLGDLYDNTPASVIAARFHKGLALAIVSMARKVVIGAGARLASRVVLSGGVMQNRWLSEELMRRFEAEKFEVILQAKVPSNDGGLSLGQAAIAAALITAG